MLSRTFRLLLVAGLVTSSVWAANDPFVGKWKVNPSKSKLNDEMKVEVAGANRYAITFAPGVVDTVVADGSDQPALRGTTLSVTVKGPNSWVVVRKRRAARCSRGIGRFPKTAKRSTTPIRNTRPTVRHRVLPYVYERTAGSSGFRGHMGQRERESEGGDRAPDPALRG